MVILPGTRMFTERMGIPKMFVHSFSERELRRAVGEVGFRVEELIRLHATRQRPLRAPWLLGSVRANGWIAVCRR